MYLPKKLFFAVWDLPELRERIRSFMWPGRRSATWYEYRDLVAACANGYKSLAKKLFSNGRDYVEALAAASAAGHIKIVQQLERQCLAYVVPKVILSGVVNDDIFRHYARKVHLGTRKALIDAVQSGSVSMCSKILSYTKTRPQLRTEFVLLNSRSELDLICWCIDEGIVVDKINDEIIVRSIAGSFSAKAILEAHRKHNVRFDDAALRLAQLRGEFDVALALVELGYVLDSRILCASGDVKLIAWLHDHHNIEIARPMLISIMNKRANDLRDIVSFVVRCVNVHDAVLAACACARYDVVSSLLSEEQYSKFPQQTRDSAREVAIDVEVIYMIQEQNFDVIKCMHRVYSFDVTPSHISAAIGSLELDAVKWLCDRYRDHPAFISLHGALSTESLDVIKYLHARYGNQLTPVVVMPGDDVLESNLRWLYLHRLVMSGSEEIVNALRFRYGPQ